MVFAFSCRPGAQALLLETERLNLQARRFKIGDKFMPAKRRDIKKKEAPAACAQQFSAHGTMGECVCIDLIKPGVGDLAAELALELPRLVKRLPKLQQPATQKMIAHLVSEFDIGLDLLPDRILLHVLPLVFMNLT